MERLQVTDLPLLAPELTLVILAVVLTVIDLVLPDRTNRSFLGWLSVVGLGVALAFTVSRYGGPYQELLNDSYRIDDFAHLFKSIMLLGAILVTILMVGKQQRKAVDVGEKFYLVVAATLGGMLMASSTELITMFVGLELLSITSYILVASNKSLVKSNEAGFKYIVLGGIASAMILYGMSFLYGLTGSTNLLEIREGINGLVGAGFGAGGGSDYEPLIYVAFFLMLAGFGFKLAMAPFHMWAPDVYQGAPTTVTAFLTAVSKIAGIAIVYRTFLFLIASPELFENLTFYVAVTAVISMIVGNTVALRQVNAKRMLAYSSIANAGYLLVPFAALTAQSFTQLIYYSLAYVLMNIGALALVMALSRDDEQGDLDIFAGLYHRSPWVAVGMTVIILSLAGIPITAGFFGKFYILWNAINSQLYWVAGVMIVTSVISYFFYFGVIRQMFMRSGVEDGFRMPKVIGIVFWFTVVATVLLGLFPNYALEVIQGIFSISEDLFGIVQQ